MLVHRMAVLCLNTAQPWATWRCKPGGRAWHLDSQAGTHSPEENVVSHVSFWFGVAGLQQVSGGWLLVGEMGAGEGGCFGSGIPSTSSLP